MRRSSSAPARIAVFADRLKEELTGRGALLSGHFLLSSGLHSDRYVQCARLLQDPVYAQHLGENLAALAPRPRPDVVVSPAMGGLFIGHELAKALRLPHIFTERVDGAMTLRRGFELEPGQKVVIVEDVLTTGKSTREVMEVVKAHGAQTVGVLSIIDRGVDPAVLGAPHRSLIKLEIQTWKPEDCPLCKNGKPVVKPGSRPKPK